MNEAQANFSPYGNDLFGNPIIPAKSGPLAERFEFPPFSVLNAREGEWQDRKRAWLSIGIVSELGRKENLSNSQELRPGTKTGYTNIAPTTSVFDPVLCELAYRWFCPPGGQIVDPFAGGSVRGIVAGLLDFRYYGIDLRPEQIAANEEQRAAIVPEADIRWACGDAVDAMADAPEADFVFTCPPYGDLERYSDDPHDLSTMEYHTFLAAYKRIVIRCYQKLKANRLACFVVGDFRDKRTGMYRGFVADTINAFRECRMELYNDAVLVTQAGTVAMTCPGYFSVSRKLGKTHQNVLVFAKGDPRKAFA